MNKILSYSSISLVALMTVPPKTGIAQKRPNLLIIHTDEQSCWTIGAYGNGPYTRKLVSTPNLDLLAAQGAILTNHIANSAVCTPSRGQLLTGRYCHDIGASTNWKPLNPDEITLAQQLKDAGYETSYIGKWHLSGYDSLNWKGPIFGFDDVKYMGITEKSVWEKNDSVFQSTKTGDEKTYQVDFLTRKTIEVIRNTHLKPFFCMLSIHDPHMPFKAREPYASMFLNDSIPLPFNFSSTYPSWGEYTITAKNYDKTVRQYLGMVKHIDDAVGQIIQALKDQGIYDNTIVVFTSDHGDYMGQHGLYSKNQFYEEVYRVPFIIRWPGKVKNGLVLDQLISNVDVMPSLLHMIGIMPNKKVQGKDFTPLLEGRKLKWENTAIQLKGDRNAGFDKNVGMITEGYHIMLMNRNQGSDNLLFDRRKDPFEQKNLYNDPEYKKVRAQLVKLICDHYTKYNVPGKDWILTLCRQ